MTDTQTETQTVTDTQPDSNQDTGKGRIPRVTEDEQDTENKEQEFICDECGGELRRDEQQGELICEDCGLVNDVDAIDRGPEWRAFDSSERDEKSRVGAPTTKMMHDKGLSTNIGWQDKDANGNALSARQRQKMQRLRTWNERFRTQDSRERNLKQALGEIQRMSSALGLNDQVEETASVLYRRCLDEDMLPGRSIEGMATACLYAAARQCGVPRSFEDFYPVSRVGEDSDNNLVIDRAYRYIASELGLAIEPTDPRDYLNRYLSELGIDDAEPMRRRAEALIDAAEDENLHSGKAPTALAGAAIYAAGLLENEKVTQTEVGDVVGKSAVTIRNRYQEMLEAYDPEDTEL